MRRCFVHVGAHKTGSKSLQHVLSAPGRKLEMLGYYYPRSGRPQYIIPHAHHNIAWEISSNRRFLRASGTLADLTAEIEPLDLDVILSSEDFESGAYHTDRFASFVERLKALRFDVTLIAYLRNQVDYAVSLYFTLLLFGLDVPFRRYLDTILEQGQYRWRDWIFGFDYDEFLSRLRCVEGVDLVLRSYDDVKNGALVGDFLSIFGLAPANLDTREDIRLNERCRYPTAVEIFYRNSTGRPPDASEQAAQASLFPPNTVAVGMSDRSKLRLIERFGASNARVGRAYGIPGFDRVLPESAGCTSEGEGSMEDVFSSELCGAVRTR